MARKTKKQKWFVPVRGSYLPNNRAGWLTYIPFTAFLLATAYVGWHSGASRGISIFYIVINWVAAAVIMTLVAKAKS